MLLGIEFQQAISVVEAIAAKTEDRIMYDQRLKAQCDDQWRLDRRGKKAWKKAWRRGWRKGWR